MDEVRSSSKRWVLGIVIVGLIIIGAYAFIKNRANADVIVGGAEYKFEILSNKRLTVISQNSSGGDNILYRITEPVDLGSGFGLRLRNKAGQIVSSYELSGSQSEGIFFQDATKTLAGVYPRGAGSHKVVATVKGQSSSGVPSKPRLVILYFNTSAVAPPTSTPRPTIYPSSVPSVRPVPSAGSTGTCTTNSAGQTVCS